MTIRDRIRRYASAAVVLAGIAGWGACYVAAAQRDAAVRARDRDLAAAELEKAGIVQAREFRERELNSMIEDLLSDQQRRAVRETGARPVMHVKAGGTTEFSVPSNCPPVAALRSPMEAATITGAGDVMEPPRQPAPSAPARLLRVTPTVHLAVFQRAASLYATGKITLGVELDGWQGTQDVELDNLEMTMSEELRRALKPRRRRPLVQFGLHSDSGVVVGAHFPIQRKAWYLPDWVGGQWEVADVHRYFVEDYYSVGSEVVRDSRMAAMVTWQVGR